MIQWNHAETLVQKVLSLRQGARTRWIIHQGFQYKVVMHGLYIAGFALLLTFGAIKFFFWRSYGVLMQQGLPLDHPIYGFLGEQERFLGAVFAIVALLSIVFGGVLGIRFSHRVAGPINRMQSHLREAAAGRAPRRLSFRENDFFKELAEAYNAELESRGKIRRPGSESNREAS